MHLKAVEMKKLVVIDACVRQDESRTRRIAEPVISALSDRYEVIRYDLPEMEEIAPLDPVLFGERGRGEIPAWALRAARDIAAADRLLIAAPFWDMSFPAVLKCFFEQTSLFDVTFTDNGANCTGLCKAPKVLYITTRGMDIPTGDPREQATPYLRALGSLWNLGELTVISAQNMDYSSPDGIESKISSCIAEGLALAREW
jgi:FMN-dependent NADH-azoreductase